MVIRRVLGAFLATSIVVIATTLGAASPAQAAAPEILVSTDGVSFTPAASVNLFDDLDLIVPGDTMDAQLWIQNSSTTPAFVRVAVTGLTVSSPVFGAAVTLTSTWNATSHTSSIGALKNCQVIAPARIVAAGTTVRVDFAVTMDPATSGLNAQGGTATLAFMATAHDAAAGPFPTANGCLTTATGGSGSSGSLAWTGVEIRNTVFVALALLGIGILLTALRRRRRDDRTQEL